MTQVIGNLRAENTFPILHLRYSGLQVVGLGYTVVPVLVIAVRSARLSAPDPGAIAT